jgi:hypothetical protein
MGTPARRRVSARQRAKWKAAGGCQLCGGKPEPGRSKCAKCAGQQAAALRSLNQRRIEQGLCPGCGKRPPAKDRSRCRQCLKVRAEASKRYHDKKAK